MKTAYEVGMSPEELQYKKQEFITVQVSSLRQVEEVGLKMAWGREGWI